MILYLVAQGVGLYAAASLAVLIKYTVALEGREPGRLPRDEDHEGGEA